MTKHQWLQILGAHAFSDTQTSGGETAVWKHVPILCTLLCVSLLVLLVWIMELVTKSYTPQKLVRSFYFGLM